MTGVIFKKLLQGQWKIFQSMNIIIITQKLLDLLKKEKNVSDNTQKVVRKANIN